MPLALRRFLFVFLPIIAIIAILAVALTSMAANAPQTERTEEEPRGLAVFVAAVEADDIRLTVRSQGEVRPLREIILAPQVSGRLVYVAPNFEDGDAFSEGDVLARIDPADYELAVTRARSSVAQARRALQSEEALAEIARRDWEDLGEGDPTPLAIREPQLAEARAALRAAQASLAEAELQLARTEVRAPFNGRVRTQDADLGALVSANSRLGQIFSTDAAEVRLPLSDNDLALAAIPVAFVETEENPGPEVTLSAIVAGEPRQWRGRIVRTDGAIDARTRTLNAIVEVDDPYGAGADAGVPLAVGLFVEAQIEGRLIPDALVAPREALRGSDRIYVAREDGTLTVRNVSVIASEPGRVVFSGGVEPGEYVITSAVRGASEGMRVEAYDADRTLLFGGPEEADENEEEQSEEDGETNNEGEDRADVEAVASAADEDGDRS